MERKQLNFQYWLFNSEMDLYESLLRIKQAVVVAVSTTSYTILVSMSTGKLRIQMISCYFMLFSQQILLSKGFGIIFSHFSFKTIFRENSTCVQLTFRKIDIGLGTSLRSRNQKSSSANIILFYLMFVVFHKFPTGRYFIQIMLTKIIQADHFQSMKLKRI